MASMSKFDFETGSARAAGEFFDSKRGVLGSWGR